MVMMAIGIGGCTALLLTGYGIQDSIQDVVNYQYEEITKYDLALSFRDSMDTEAQSAFAAAHGGALGSILYLSQNSMDCTRGSVTKSVSVTAAEGNSTEGFFDLHDGIFFKTASCRIRASGIETTTHRYIDRTRNFAL